jgi:hypothetical protein
MFMCFMYATVIDLLFWWPRTIVSRLHASSSLAFDYAYRTHTYGQF